MRISKWISGLIAVLGLVASAHAVTPMVSAGGTHSLALRSDGVVLAWGENTFGELGDGTTLNHSLPAPVFGLSNVIYISAGQYHSLAVKSDGTVWAWGNNSGAQLGDGTIVQHNTPTMVQGLPAGAIAVAAGGQHSLALISDGSVWAWGRNYAGQIGDSTTIDRVAPKLVVGVSGSQIIQIAAGTGNSMALSAGGATGGFVYVWGDNSSGQVGDNSTTNRPDATVANGPNGFVAIAAGGSHSVGMRVDGSVWTWGNNGSGQLCLGGGANRSAPVAGPQLSFGFIGVGAGGSTTHLIKADTSVYACGANSNGQLGDGSNTLKNVPSPSYGLIGFTQVSGGGFHTLALKSDGTVIAVGSNQSGQLGDGTLVSNNLHTNVMSIDGSVPLNLILGPQTGWWWNPAESGRGYAIEVRGSNMFMASYLYQDTGAATWLVSTGAMTSPVSYAGTLLSFANGQTLTGAYTNNTATPSPGTIALAFTDPTHGTLTTPGGTIPIERFNILPGGLAAPPAFFQPETGWWWNPAEPGRGWAMEVQNGYMFLAGYMYGSAGPAVWYVSLQPMTAQKLFQGSLLEFKNGQSLRGTYVAPVLANGNVGTVTVQFLTTTTATLTLPDGRQIPIQRFVF